MESSQQVSAPRKMSGGAVSAIILTLIIIVIIIIFFVLMYRGKGGKENFGKYSKNVYTVTKNEKKYFKHCKNILNYKNPKNDTQFDDNFLLGFSSAPYQYEGGWTEGGRGLANWDTYMFSGLAPLTNTGQFTANFYDAWKDDIRRLKLMGVRAFRFGIAWSRIFPNGEDYGSPNQHGIDFYRKVLDELDCNGIRPVICLMHWDYPAALNTKLVTLRPPGKERDYITKNNKEPNLVALSYRTGDKGVKQNSDGTYNEDDNVLLENVLMKSWEHYVKAVTEHLVIPYQKRAKNKIAYISSINEITTIANNAYSMGEMAPGISVSRPQNFFGDWNSSYWAMYNLINMHRRAYDIITTRIKTSRITTIPVTADNTTLGGFTLGFKTSNDEPAYDRAIDWILKMVFDPIIHGKWSESVEDFFDGKHFYINNGADWRGSFPPTDKKAFYKPEMNTCDLIAYHIYNSCYTSLFIQFSYIGSI